MANIISYFTFTKEIKIGSIHALKSVELKEDNGFNKFIKFSYKYLYGNFYKVVCISKDIKSDLIEKCGFKHTNKLQVIYNPHDVEKLMMLSNESINNKEELKLFSKKTIVFIGRLSIQKSPWHLINAFYLLQKKKIDVNLIFIGDGNSDVLKHIKSQINRYNINDKVFFLGRKSNPFKYLKHANVLALSSHYEGTPNVIVESIAIGVPIVSSYCTKGITELMSLHSHKVSEDNIILESGIVTPNLYNGHLGIPISNDFTKEEEKFAQGLEAILSSLKFKDNLLKKRNELLKKFDVKMVSKKYLN